MNPNYNDELIIAVVVTTILLLLLASFSVSYLVIYRRKKREHQIEIDMNRKEFQRELLQSQIEVQEATYSSLGKELHDNVGQLLSSAKMLIGVTERQLTNPPDTLNTANETLGKAINELRSLSKTLNKEWLEQFNLIENLKDEAARINPANIVKLHLLHPSKIDLKVDEQIILFRIIQEAIQNAIKHSQAKNIYVDIIIKDILSEITIKDDGNGFDLNLKSNGVGILNMKQRTKLLGGNITWANKNNGTTVFISLPNKIN